MHLFAGSSHPALATALAEALGTSLGAVTLKTFSCGERYVKFDESVRGKDVFILQTSTHRPNEDLMELFLLCQAAKLGFARSIHAIIPNFPYARQDRVSAPREPISAKLVAHLLEESGATHVITLNLHSHQIQGFFSIPVDVLDASPILAEDLRRKQLGSAVIVAPDIGSAKEAKKFADLLGMDLAVLHKSRPEHQQVEILNIVGDVEGRTCVIFDDMIDTAGTLVSARKALLERGARDQMYAITTHGIFSGPAADRLRGAGFAEVIATDTVPTAPDAFPGLRILSVAPLLAEVIRHIERGESVTDIYRK